VGSFIASIIRVFGVTSAQKYVQEHTIFFYFKSVGKNLPVVLNIETGLLVHHWNGFPS